MWSGLFKRARVEDADENHPMAVALPRGPGNGWRCVIVQPCGNKHLLLCHEGQRVMVLGDNGLPSTVPHGYWTKTEDRMVVRFHHTGDESRAKTFTVEPVAGTNNVWKMQRSRG